MVGWLSGYSLGQFYNTSLSTVQILALIYLALAIFLIYIGIVYYKLRYVVRIDGLQIMLFPFTLTIHYDTIYEIDLRPPKKVEGPPGWGLRIWGNSMFAISGTKPCLYIKRLEGIVKEFYLSSGDPENLASRIKINMRRYFAPRNA